jgi:hypothetical protein
MQRMQSARLMGDSHQMHGISIMVESMCKRDAMFSPRRVQKGVQIEEERKKARLYMKILGWLSANLIQPVQ